MLSSSAHSLIWHSSLVDDAQILREERGESALCGLDLAASCIINLAVNSGAGADYSAGCSLATMLSAAPVPACDAGDSNAARAIGALAPSPC